MVKSSNICMNRINKENENTKYFHVKTIEIIYKSQRNSKSEGYTPPLSLSLSLSFISERRYLI